MSASRLRPILSALVWIVLCLSARAITGQAPPANGWAARPNVMVIDGRGDLCTGTALARDLVLTAAHCVTLPVAYRRLATEIVGSISASCTVGKVRICSLLYLRLPRNWAADRL